MSESKEATITVYEIGVKSTVVRVVHPRDAILQVEAWLNDPELEGQAVSVRKRQVTQGSLDRLWHLDPDGKWRKGTTDAR